MSTKTETAGMTGIEVTGRRMTEAEDMIEIMTQMAGTTETEISIGVVRAGIGRGIQTETGTGIMIESAIGMRGSETEAGKGAESA